MFLCWTIKHIMLSRLLEVDKQFTRLNISCPFVEYKAAATHAFLHMSRMNICPHHPSTTQWCTSRVVPRVLVGFHVVSYERRHSGFPDSSLIRRSRMPTFRGYLSVIKLAVMRILNELRYWKSNLFDILYSLIPKSIQQTSYIIVQKQWFQNSTRPNGWFETDSWWCTPPFPNDFQLGYGNVTRSTERCSNSWKILWLKKHIQLFNWHWTRWWPDNVFVMPFKLTSINKNSSYKKI